MQGTILHKRSSHACFVKRNWTYVLIKYLCTSVNDFVCIFHPKLFTKVHQFDLVLTDTENMTSHYSVKTPKHNLQNKFKIWNIDEKKYRKMEVCKFLYFALVNFSLMLFTLWSSILFHDQFTDSLLHCLHPVLVNYEILLDWMMSEAFQCYRGK